MGAFESEGRGGGLWVCRRKEERGCTEHAPKGANKQATQRNLKFGIKIKHKITKIKREKRVNDRHANTIISRLLCEVVCVCARVCVCACACVRVCVRNVHA